MIAIVGALGILLFVLVLLYVDHRRAAKHKHAH